MHAVSYMQATSSKALGKERADNKENFARLMKAWAKQPPPTQAEEEPDESTIRRAKLLAIKLFIGLLVDGVPEGVLLGFLAAGGHLQPVLVISLFIANFPEAFSASSLLIQGRMESYKIVGAWAGLCGLVGVLGGISCWILLFFYPDYGPGSILPMHIAMLVASVEGLAGGAMIACIASVMLPEAFEESKGGSIEMSSGFLCTAGFLCAVALKGFL